MYLLLYLLLGRWLPREGIETTIVPAIKKAVCELGRWLPREGIETAIIISSVWSDFAKLGRWLPREGIETMDKHQMLKNAKAR